MIQYEAPEIKINSQGMDCFVKTLIFTIHKHETNSLLFLRDVVVSIFIAIEKELEKRGVKCS